MRPSLQHLGALGALGRISRRTWILIATGVVTLFVLVVCLAVFSVVQLWRTGSTWLGDGQTGVAAVAEAEARRRLGALLPGLEPTVESGQQALSDAVGDARQSLESMVPGALESADRGRAALAVAAPGAAARLEAETAALLGAAGIATGIATGQAGAARAADVPGEDIDAVPRHPALSRSAYTFSDGRRAVRYAGPVGFEQALAFHRAPLVEAGYVERILVSSADGFSAEYTLADKVLLLTVAPAQDASSEVAISER